MTHPYYSTNNLPKMDVAHDFEEGIATLSFGGEPKYQIQYNANLDLWRVCVVRSDGSTRAAALVNNSFRLFGDAELAAYGLFLTETAQRQNWPDY